MARRALANQLKGHLPGRHSELFRTGDTFRHIFYPSYRSVPYEGNVSQATGLSSSFWSDFSVAVLCQSIYWQTSDARDRINISQVNSAVSNYNNSVRAKAVAWYAYVIFHNYMHYQGDRNNAKRIYMEQLNSAHWVTAKQEQLINGSWNNPSWELFHHWVKLSALGASDAEISSLIGTLKKRGLIIESVVDADHWRNYFVWYHPNNLDHSDVDSEARAGELASVYLASPYGYGSNMREENSYEFIAHSQPGSKYWKAPSSSCLSGNSLVLMASGNLKPIKDIKAGENIKTSSGTSQVRLVSTPKTGDRSVYKINNLPFYFTEAHPFLHFSKEPRYVAVSSLKLLNNVPLLGQYGIGSLQVGTQLLAYDGSMITVTSLEKVKPDENDEFVYDLIIEPSPEGKFEYFAGSVNNCFSIASELPTAKNFSKAEQLAFQVIMTVISDSAEKLNTLYQSSSDHSKFLYEIDRISRFIDAGFLHGDRSSNRTVNEIPSPHEVISSTNLYSLATKSCQVKDGTFNQASGAAYDLFMQKLFYPIVSSLELGHRIVPTSSSFDYLAVSVNEFHVVAPIKLPSLPTVHIHVPAQEPITSRIDKKEMQIFGCRFHQSHYVSMMPSLTQENFDVKFDVPVLLSKEVKGRLTATLFVSPASPHGFIQRRILPLFDGNGTEQGYIHVDVRNLHEEHLDTELKKAKEWNEGSQQQLALLIESTCKDIFATF